MDFDEYEYLENTVENPEAKSEKVKLNGDLHDSEEKERKRSSRRKNNDDYDEMDHRPKRLKSGDDLREHEKERSSRRHSSSKDREGSERDARKSSREHRDRKERDRDNNREERSRKEGGREERSRKEGDREERSRKERDREERGRDGKKDDTVRKERGNEVERDGEREKEQSRRSRSHMERPHEEQEGERSREREKSRDRHLLEREKEIRTREREGNRRHKDKKEDRVEPEADPERDQKTVFAHQISLKADERDVFEFFSRVGKVRDVRLILDRITKRSKGCGYVEFYDVMSVPMAITLCGQPLLGIPVMVKPSEAEKNLVQPTASMTTGAGGISTVGARKLYVGNLHLSIREDQLRQVFEAFGTVELVQLPTDLQTGQCKGFGFVQFARLEDAKAAQSLNGQLELAGRVIKVSAVTDQTVGQDIAVNAGDIDDDDGGLSLNASSRALLMQKLDRSGTASSFAGSFSGAPAGPGIPLPLGSIIGSNPGVPFGQVPIPAVPGLPNSGLTLPSVDAVGVPSECLLLKNMFDPKLETEPDFDLDIKEDVQDECSKHGTLKHIYVDKNSEGFVYLRFEVTPAAMSAQRALHGRWFAGKMITATYMAPQAYEAQFPGSG